MKTNLNIARIFKGSKAYGVSIWINNDDSIVFETVIISLRINKLTFSDNETFSGFEQFEKKAIKRIPAYISVDGKGVMHKMIDRKDESSSLDSILINANADEFLVQEHILDDNKMIISLSRKERINQIIGIFDNLGIHVLRMTLGPFTVIKLNQLLDKCSNILIPYYSFLLNNGNIGFERNQIKNPDFSISIDGEDLESRYLVAFSNSLFHFGVGDLIILDYPEILHQADDFKFRILTHLAGRGVLLILFVGLLINYLLFENFSKRNQDLTAQIESNNEIIGSIEKLKLQVKIREELFKNINSDKNPLFVFYFDRIAKELPYAITLSKLCIAPPENNKSSAGNIQFVNDLIIISGNTSTSGALDLWLKSLGNLNWIREIVIKNYSDNNDIAKFDLEIYIRMK